MRSSWIAASVVLKWSVRSRSAHRRRRRGHTLFENKRGAAQQNPPPHQQLLLVPRRLLVLDALQQVRLLLRVGGHVHAPPRLAQLLTQLYERIPNSGRGGGGGRGRRVKLEARCVFACLHSFSRVRVCGREKERGEERGAGGVGLLAPLRCGARAPGWRARSAA
jgi:hypothetical protein